MTPKKSMTNILEVLNPILMTLHLLEPPLCSPGPMLPSPHTWSLVLINISLPLTPNINSLLKFNPSHSFQSA